eukprot:scaffold45760_cov25-Prasinocladus_malaysianus.AAC.1
MSTTTDSQQLAESWGPNPYLDLAAVWSSAKVSILHLPSLAQYAIVYRAKIAVVPMLLYL